MYKYFLLLLGSASIISSCGKEKPQNPESVFYLGDIEVKTRKFQAYSFDGKTKLRLFDYLPNGESLSFTIGFHYGDFPYKDSIEVSYDGKYIDQCNIGFHKGGIQYLVDNDNITFLHAAIELNGNAKYTLPPTWFYSQYPDPTNSYFIKGNDSILVQGTFYESNDVVIR